MKSISGAEAVIRCLIKENVDVLFGYPGGAIMPVYDELYKFQDKVHHILTRHEQGATHAAQGYARSSGKVGVAIATSGPGATNLVTGIADAQIDSTPMVCITGQVASSLLGSDAFQETDIIGISTPVTKWNYHVIVSTPSRCVIILNSSKKVIGVISEGDIIRLLLEQVNLKSPLKNVINKSFQFLNSDQKIDDNMVFDIIFRGVTLIPIINNNRELVDIIVSSDFLKNKMIRNK